MRRAARALLLASLAFPSLAAAQQVLKPTAEQGERSGNLEVRAGAGIDSNVLHDPQASQLGALLRVDLSGEIEPKKDLRLSLVAWFDEHLPQYTLNEVSVQPLVLWRRPLARHLAVRLGSFSEVHRELATFVVGTVLTHGAILLNDVAEHLAVGLEIPLGKFDIEVGPEGHAKYVFGTDSYGVYGVDGSVALRWVPLRAFAVRARYLFLYQDVKGLDLLNLKGVPTGVNRDLTLYTQQADLSVRGRPLPTLDLFLRYEYAHVTDNYLGYLTGNENRLVGGVRWDEDRHWVIDLVGRLVERDYPLRIPSNIDNQSSDLELEVLLDAEYWLHKHWGLFARYQFNGEVARPFGTIFLQHIAVAGVATRVGGSW